MEDRIDYETVRHLCGDLLDLDDEEREAELLRLEQSRPALHREIISILSAYRWTSQSRFLEPSAIDATAPMRTDDASPDAIDGYEILDELGRGASGVVYHARSTRSIERDVAVKVLRHGATAGQRSRFVTERQTLANFNHPHIAQIYAAGVLDDDRPWVAVEYVKGRSITRFAAAHDLGWRGRVGLLVQVCNATQEVHRKGLMHGDLKPSNILITSATPAPIVKLVDFGSVMIAGDAGPEGIEWLQCTLGYSAPERLGGDAPCPESDVFSLGVLIAEVIGGRHPLDGLAPQERLQRLSSGTMPPVQLETSGIVASELRGIIDRCCDPSPARRYRAAGEVADDLRRVLASEPVLARPRRTIRTMRLAIRRRPVPAALIGTTAILLLAIVAREWQVNRTMLIASQREQATRSLLVDNLLTRLEHRSGQTAMREVLANAVLESLEEIPGAAEDPTLTRHRVQALETLGSIALERNDANTSRDLRLQALGLIEALRREDPTDPDLAGLHRTARILVGDTFLHVRDTPGAMSWYRGVHEELLDDHAQHPDDERIALALGWSHNRLARVLTRDHPDEAAGHVDAGTELARSLAESNLAESKHLHLLARLRLTGGLLASSPTRRLALATEALDAITRADRLDPNRWAYLTLIIDARIRVSEAMIELRRDDSVDFALATFELAERFERSNPDELTAVRYRDSAAFILDQARDASSDDSES